MAEENAEKLRDLNYAEIIRFVENLSLGISDKDDFGKLADVANLFMFSVHRLTCLAVLPVHTIRLARKFEIKRITKVTPKPSKMLDDSKYSAAMLDGLAISMFQVNDGVQSLLASLIIEAWTGFETFAGDLWEAALNCHPAGLCLLDGTPNRITQLAGTGVEKDERAKHQEQEGQQERGASILLSDLQNLTKKTFVIADYMGSILRRRFNFQTLAGIREAFARAFSERSTKVDKALANKSFDALCIVRNALVHASGVADEKYSRRQSGIPLAPASHPGKWIELDGANVSAMIDAELKASVELLKAVDQWIKAK